ncbi:MAG: hypothetical protein H7Z41_05625 [Cytophagales bacterium]|nr:hypothetical protein [Armatimonadota bacterium]
MTRIEMIKLIVELNNCDVGPMSTGSFSDRWDRLIKHRADVLENAPKEWLPVAVDLLLNYPTPEEYNAAFPFSNYEWGWDEEQWLFRVGDVLQEWAHYAPDLLAEEIAPIVDKRGEQRACLLLIATEAKNEKFPHLLETVVNDFSHLTDEEQAGLLGAVGSTPGPNSDKVHRELIKQIQAQPVIGPETAEELERNMMRSSE